MSASFELIEKLVCSDHFCKYVLNPDKEIVAYWDEFRRKNPDKEEAIIQARQLVLLLGDDKDVDDPEIDIKAEYIWRSISKNMRESSSGQRKKDSHNSIAGYVLKVAAVFLILGLISLIIVDLSPALEYRTQSLTENYFYRDTQIGQKGSFYLPDGSHINLNSGSSLYYYEDPETSTRELTLEGEAFLDIKRDPARPFIVRTKNLTASVLGTSFNVKAYPSEEETKIALVTGKVKVKAEDSNTQVLTPNHMVVFNWSEKSAEKKLFDPEKITCWKDGILLFEEVSLREVFTTLSRWYGVEFVISGTLKGNKEIFDLKDYQGKYKDKSLETVLEAISFSYDFNYRIEGKNVFIK